MIPKEVAVQAVVAVNSNKEGIVMPKSIKVEVFGIKNQTCGGGCSCNGGCSPSKTMGDMYNEFLKYLSKSKIRNRIDITFKDILMDNMEGYESVIQAMEQGYVLPLTAINGEIMFYGGISNRMIYEVIRKKAL